MRAPGRRGRRSRATPRLDTLTLLERLYECGRDETRRQHALDIVAVLPLQPALRLRVLHLG